MTSIVIDQPVIDTTEGCRYCLMCRHVCPVTRVTFNEATSPHGWALEIASVRRGLLDWNAETTDRLYQCADCGLCQSFCVTDQPLPDAIVAARAEVVAAGCAPASVAEIDAALRRWGNSYGVLTPAPEATEWGETAIFVGSTAFHREWESVHAARRLLERAGLEHALAAVGRSSGYLAYTLGLHDTARQLARATVAELEHLGCRRLVVLSPGQEHTLKHVYPLLGVALPEQIEVIDLPALLTTLLDAGRLKFAQTDVQLAYHDACQTPRIDGRWRAPRRLLAALTSQQVHEGFWREKRATPCGASGGLPWTQPDLAADLARAALTDATRNGARLIVTDAPQCLAHLRGAATAGVEVRGLYEMLAEQIEN
ncbi:MAG: (Fe-S)-binding protein [Roseiflexaceae bacterium]